MGIPSIFLWPLRLAVLATVLLAPPLRAQPTIQDLEESLTCQCGCGLTVHSCNHVDCSSAIPLRKEIREQLALGKSREEILRYFVGKYGEKILSSPTFQGFNVLAWVAPFAVLGLGGAGLLVLMRRWARGTSAQPSPAPNPAPPAGLERYRRELEEELKHFEES
jgi:cytochrome c-type biogenesis protein CcmH